MAVSDMVRAVTEAGFEREALSPAGPVLVDFWAGWCPPCRRLAPTLEALAAEYQGRLTVLKVDVDENPELSARYGIRSIPTLILFKDGHVADRKLGALPMDELRRFVDAQLAPMEAIA